MGRSSTLLRAATILVAALAAALGADAQGASTPGKAEGAAAEPAQALEEAGRVLDGLAQHSVGLSAAVARHGAVVWSSTRGACDLERREPVSADSLFRLYSLSKTMTAVATAHLVEQRRLDPDAPVQRYVPHFPRKEAPITTMHLATHTSGIRHYASDGEARSLRHCEDVDAALRLFADDPLVHPPGERKTYSSHGYVLLSAVLEGASGSSYEEAMRALVFRPLGLASLAIDDPTADLPRRCGFHEEMAPGTFAVAEPVDNTCKWGAGAWLGTASDVARFGLVLADETLLSRETRALFLEGQPTFRAQGWGAGGMAFLLVSDEHGASVALLSNAAGEHLGARLQAALEALLAAFTKPRSER